ncbi:MAG: RtcB family protein [Deltaproteobacteria bacterium]|nr:RtcB family protein [Deltaproteobacteria bacterium]
MISELKGKNVPIKMWARVEEVESGALDQLRNVASLPWVAHHVAVMPDVHFGRGATVGSVIAMRGAVAPAAVGVDIGCGMAAVKTGLTAKRLPSNLHKLRLAIEETIPVGFSAHDELAIRELTGRDGEALKHEVKQLFAGFEELDPHADGLRKKAGQQLGTLGGGNHFIELCLDTEDNVWLMLHSGSRNIGKELAEVHMFKARKLEHNQALKDRDLAVFLAGTPEMTAYRRDLFWAQEYARLNRAVMLKLYMQVLEGFFPAISFEQAVYCHHNYVAEETHFGEELMVTRKGAIRAGVGELGIIPGSMGTKSYIVRGRGNPEAFESASHGAGRRMSRSKAKQKFTLEDFREQTEGVECRKDQGVLDEIPKAYKDIDKVMAMQQDLVEIVAELKQVLCVKG